MRSIIFILLCTPCFSNAQVLKGTIIDINSSKPIAFASVGDKGTTTGTVSNESGKFSLDVNGADSIIISHLNYGLNKFKIKLGGSNLTFKLKPIALSLDEVLVTNKTIPQILNKAVQKSEAALSTPIYLHTYYREFVKTNENYTKFSDGLVHYYLEKKKNGKLKIKTWVTDSRAIELYDEEEEEFDWDITSPLNIQNGPKSSIISNIKFLRPEEQVKYDFDIKSLNSTNGSKWLIISIYPKEELQEALFEGTVAIDNVSGLIMQVDLQLPERSKKFVKEINALVIKGKTLDSKTKIIFNQSNEHYHISYVYKDRAVNFWNKKRINEKFRFTSDLIVSSFSDSNSNLTKNDMYSKKSLYKRKKPVKSSFWLESNALDLTDDQQQIIESLKSSSTPGN